MWDWIDNPHRRYLCTSFKNSLAEHFSEQASKIFKSEWYQTYYALPREITIEKDTIEYFSNSKTGSRRCTAYDTATGFGVAGGVLIVDDPHPVAVSSDVRNQQVEYFNKGLSNRPGAQGSIVVLGQRVDPDDLIGTLLDIGGWEHVCLPNEYDPRRSRVTVIGWQDPRTEEDQLLWPDVFTAEKTAQAKRYGLTHYTGQYNQSPVRKGGNIFNRDDFRTYTEDTLPKEFDSTILTMDTSFKDTKGSDYCVIQVWSRAGANFYLRDQRREQADFTKTLQMLLDMCHKWPTARARYVEESSNGHAIISTLKNRISGIIAVGTKNQSKVSRYQSVAPLVSAHNVYLPCHADWLEEFLLEAESVPASRHDDQMDAMAMALTKLEVSVPFTDVFGKHILF
jgi:predicted phage terminase large subunit-like protein